MQFCDTRGVAMSNKENTWTRIYRAYHDKSNKSTVSFCNKCLNNGNSACYKKYVRIAAILTLIPLSAIILYVIVDFMFHDEEKMGHLGDHYVYNKRDWGGEKATKRQPLEHPTGLVIISHSATHPCHTFKKCSAKVRSFQKYHMAKNLYDIGYNFIIGGDGNIYIGRGWDTVNFHKQLSIGINFIGEFNFDNLNSTMIEATRLLLDLGLRLQKLSDNYILVGHNQSNPNVPLSPGENVCKEIRNWPHYSNITLFH